MQQKRTSRRSQHAKNPSSRTTSRNRSNDPQDVDCCPREEYFTPHYFKVNIPCSLASALVLG